MALFWNRKNGVLRNPEGSDIHYGEQIPAGLLSDERAKRLMMEGRIVERAGSPGRPQGSTAPPNPSRMNKGQLVQLALSKELGEKSELESMKRDELAELIEQEVFNK